MRPVALAAKVDSDRLEEAASKTNTDSLAASPTGESISSTHRKVYASVSSLTPLLTRAL